MARDPFAIWLIGQEARALLTRLGRLRPVALQETMVPAARVSTAALRGIEGLLGNGRRELHGQLRRFLAWLAVEGPHARAEEAQRKFTFLKLRFNAVLTQLDIFSEAMSQRSEAETGAWLAGLDVAAADALELPGVYEAPPVVCYLARDPGGAIRRARTRLPGGGENPVALVRIPRERMIGSGVASSLVHEVGHQAADLLDLVAPARASLLRSQPPGGAGLVWRLWARWISEILADLWAVSRVGVASTLGLVALVSLPRAFVFRPSLEGPHPTPWIRVKLSCALGDALYPDPQWSRIARAWEACYPPAGLAPDAAAFLRALEASIPRLVAAVLDFRPRALGGTSLGRLLADTGRTPARLSMDWTPPHGRPLAAARPTVALAALAQARLDGRISPEAEAGLLADLLKAWAVAGVLRGDGTGPRVRRGRAAIRWEFRGAAA